MVLNIVKKLVERYTDGNITAVITKANFSTDVFFSFFQKFGNIYFLEQLYMAASEYCSAIVLCFIINLQLAKKRGQ